MPITLSISASQNSQSIPNNTTSLGVSVVASWTYGSYDHNGSSKYVTIDGATYYFSAAKVNPSRTTSGSQTLYSTTVNIPHNTEGDKTVALYASVKTATSSGTVTASRSVVLTTIPRTSQATLSAASVTTGGTVTVYTNRSSTAFTHNIAIKIGTKTLSANGVGASYTFTIPREWAEAVTSSDRGTAKMTCVTYSGSTKIGEITAKDLTIIVNSADKPTLDTVSISPHNANATVEAWGICLQGHSAAEATFTKATGIYGSTITGYRITSGSTTVSTSPYRTQIFAQSGTQKVYCAAKDSRGRWSDNKELTIDVISYAKPSLSGTEVYRCNSTGDKDEKEGRYISAIAKAVYASCSNKNTATLKCRYGLADGAYGPETTMESEVKSIVGDNAIQITKTYKAEISITDALNNTYSIEFEIPTKKVALSFMDDIKGAGIGKVAEKENTLQVAFDTEILGGLTVANVDMTITEAEYDELIALLGE